MGKYTASTTARVKVDSLDVPVELRNGVTFKVQKVTMNFNRSWQDEHVQPVRTSIYGYRVDETGDQSGHYRRVQLTGELPEQVQAIVDEQRDLLDGPLGEPFKSDEGKSADAEVEDSDVEDDGVEDEED